MTRPMTRGQARARGWTQRRQAYWVLHVTGTALATFTAAAVLSAVVVAVLVRTRPRRWQQSASRQGRVTVP